MGHSPMKKIPISYKSSERAQARSGLRVAFAPLVLSKNINSSRHRTSSHAMLLSRWNFSDG